MYSFQERFNQFLVVLLFALAFFYFGFLIGEWNHRKQHICPTPDLRVLPQKQKEQIKAIPYTSLDRSENIY